MKKSRCIRSLVIVVGFLMFLAIGCGQSSPPDPEDPVPPPDPVPESRSLVVHTVDANALVLKALDSEDFPPGEAGLLDALQLSLPGSTDAVSLRGDLAVITLRPGWLPATPVEQVLGLYALVNTACADAEVRRATFVVTEGDEWSIPLDVEFEPDHGLMEEDWWNEPFQAIGDECSVATLDVPQYFRSVGWSATGALIGLSGDYLGDYDLEAGVFHPWNITAWNAVVSPAGTHVALQDGSGVHYLAVSDRIVHSLETPELPLEGESLGIISWSPDGEYLLCAAQHEWDATYYLYRLADATWQALDLKVDGYFLTHGGHWFDADTLLFDVRASRGRDGSTGYREAGFRGDVLLYSLSDGDPRVITDARDGEFWKALGCNESGGWFLLREEGSPGRMFSWSVPGEGDPILAGEASYVGGYVAPEGSVVGIAASPMLHGPFAWFRLDRIDEEGTSPCLRIRGASYPEKVQWAGDGLRAAVTSRRAEVDDPRGEQYAEVLSTVVVSFPRR